MKAVAANLAAISVIFLLSFSSVYFVVPPSKAPLAPTSTSTTISQPLVPFTGRVSSVSKPPPVGQMGLDKGTNQIRFTQTQVQFFRPSGGNITIGFPSFGVAVTTQPLKNSTHIQYHYTGTVLTHAADFTMTLQNRTGVNPYDRKISLRGTLVGLVGTLPMTIALLNSQSLPVTVCDSLAHIGIGGITIPPCTRQCFGSMCFDWADSAASASYNNVTKVVTLTVGTNFTLDPLALDGSGQVQCNGTISCASTITTASNPDVIMMMTWCYNNVANTPITVSSVSGASLTWTKRTSVTNTANAGRTDVGEEWYAIASNTLSGASITVTYSAICQAGGITPNQIIFGVSGANTGSPFDSNGALPATSTTGFVSVSTSNANDFIFGSHVANSVSFTAQTGFTMIQEAQNFGAEYKIVSTIQSGLSLSYFSTSQPPWFVAIGDAIQQAGLTQPVKITLQEAGAPTETLAISNCSPSPATIIDDGAIHNIIANANCAMTITVAADTTNNRYRFKEGTIIVAVTTWTFTTCASGTCAEKDNNTYYQLRNLYQATPVGPTVWDAVYSISVTGTYVGVASTAGSGSPISTTSGGGAASAQVWLDYNLIVTVLKSFGSTWTAFGPNTFTQTTGGNTDNVNYTFAAPNTTLGAILVGAIILSFLFIFITRRKTFG